MPFIFSTTPLTQLDQSLPSGKPSLKKRIHEEKNRFAWLSNKIKIRFILTAKLFKMETRGQMLLAENYLQCHEERHFFQTGEEVSGPLNLNTE